MVALGAVSVSHCHGSYSLCWSATTKRHIKVLKNPCFFSIQQELLRKTFGLVSDVLLFLRLHGNDKRQQRNAKRLFIPLEAAAAAEVITNTPPDTCVSNKMTAERLGQAVVQ